MKASDETRWEQVASEDTYDDRRVDSIEEAEAAIESLLGTSVVGLPKKSRSGNEDAVQDALYIMSSSKEKLHSGLHKTHEGTNADFMPLKSFDPLEISLDDTGDGEYEEGHVRDGSRRKMLSEYPHYSWMDDIWAIQNRAVPASYFCVGVASNFLRTPLGYYMVHDLDVSPTQQNVVFTLVLLPWSFKLVYGFISDNCPINGMRRKPYFIGGWLVYSLSNLMLAALGHPNVKQISFLLLLSMSGLMFSDVVTDAIIVERSKNEPEAKRGHMQATGYATRFVGSLLGSILGTCVYNQEQWGWGLTISEIFLVNSLFPLLLIGPFVWNLQETICVSNVGNKMEILKARCSTIFGALSLRAVYVPMAVVFTYNIFQVPNAAWRSFLIEGLKFDNFDLGLIGIGGSLFSSCGLLAYKQFFMGTGWRTIYYATAGLTCFFSIVQLLLIFRINKRYGIGDLVFALGDDALAEFVLAIQFLPVCQMYICMCPDGTEGTTYAILTTLSNLAGSVSLSIGTLFTKIWDVSNDTFAQGHFSGMWKLTVLTSAVQIIPLFAIRWLPGSAEEQRAMQKCNTSNKWGGIVFCTVLFGSLILIVTECIIETLK